MRRFVQIARTGLAAILLHPLRSFVVTASVVVTLVPFLVGLGISSALQREATASLEFGGDLYVTGQCFGRNVPIPQDAVGLIQAMEGVRKVVPRIVGRIELGRQHISAVVVGIAAEQMAESFTRVRGRLPQAGKFNEVVLGSELARRLDLDVGSLIPPFYRNAQGERVSKVVGVFQSDVALWQADLMFTSLDTAAAYFNQNGWVTDLVVYCRPRAASDVRARILETVTFSPHASVTGPIRPKVVTREELEALLPRGLMQQEGIFHLHFLLVFVVGILVVLVTSGFGLSGRRQEIGILKACGWQTDEVLLRSLVETCLLSLTAASLSVLLAYTWLRWLNGYWIAAILLSGVERAPGFQVPFELSPFAHFLSLLISLILMMTGTLYATWKAAVVPPVEAMR